MLTVASRGFGQRGTATTTYTVDASNATVTKNNATSSVSSIAVGDNVFVQGTISGTSVTATKIFDGQFRGGMMGSVTGSGQGFGFGPGGVRPAVIGQVASISGTTLTVTSRGFGSNPGANPGSGQNGTATTTYTVDASNATVIKNNATSSVSSIAVGDTIAVVGTVSGTNVTATSIRDSIGGMGMMGGRGNGNNNGKGGSTGSSTGTGAGTGAGAIIQGNGQPIIAGTVSTLSGTTFSVTNNGSATYSVDASSATVVKGNATSTVSNIAVGDHVVVQGAVNGTSVTASSVIDSGAATTGGRGLGGFLGSIGSFFQHLFGF
jgi:hypothetical protein